MQDSDADQGRRVGVDEKFIHFRSSPNFKKMKKFLKSKIDEKSVSTFDSPASLVSEQSNYDIQLLKSKIDEKTVSTFDSPASLVSEQSLDAMQSGGRSEQPPLPLGPPPPDSPGHDAAVPDHQADEFSEEVLRNIKKEKEDSDKVVKTDVCRDFIRGACTRSAGTCRFLHKHDLTQLKGVYTFCHNYQNSTCKYKNCRYVHASIFEEAEFYRTGVLPPHATAHHKNNASVKPAPASAPPAPAPAPSAPPRGAVKLMPPPPPPPPKKKRPDEKLMPQPAPQKKRPDESMPMQPPAVNMGNPPPTMPLSMSIVKQGSTPPSPAAVSAASKPGFDNAALINNFNVASLNLDNGVKASKCPNCDVLKNRLLHTQGKAETINTCIKDIKDKIEELDKKEKRLNAVLIFLLNQQSSQRPQIGNE